MRRAFARRTGKAELLEQAVGNKIGSSIDVALLPCDLDSSSVIAKAADVSDVEVVLGRTVESQPSARSEDSSLINPGRCRS